MVSPGKTSHPQTTAGGSLISNLYRVQIQSLLHSTLGLQLVCLKPGISYDRGDSWTSIDNSAQTLSLDFADAQTGFAGKWQLLEDLSPTLIYNYIGSPLTSLLDPKPLAIDLLVSPNPTSDFIKITVTAGTPDRYLILINDISGKLVYRSETVKDGQWTEEINIASLPAGTYTLSIATTTGVRTESVVKL